MIYLSDDRLNELLNEIKRISPLPDDEQLSEELIDRYYDIFEQIEKYNNPSVIPILVNSLGIGEGYGVYQSVISYLEHFDTEDLLPHLFLATKNGQKGARKWGAYLLGICRDNRALPSLLSLLSDPEEDVRMFSIIALEMIGDSSVAPQLQYTKKMTHQLK